MIGEKWFRGSFWSGENFDISWDMRQLSWWIVLESGTKFEISWDLSQKIKRKSLEVVQNRWKCKNLSQINLSAALENGAKARGILKMCQLSWWIVLESGAKFEISWDLSQNRFEKFLEIAQKLEKFWRCANCLGE